MQIIINKLNEILSYVKGSDPSRYVDLNELIQITNLSKSTLRRYVKKGVLKASNNTGKLLFKVSDVEKFIND